MKECAKLINNIDTKVEFVSQDLVALRADSEHARVGQLVESLTEVALKVIMHETCIRDLIEKVAHIEHPEKSLSQPWSRVSLCSARQ